MPEVVVAEDEEAAVPHRRLLPVVKLQLEDQRPDTRVPSTQTCPRVPGQGARCTIGGGSQLSSVRNHPPAHGKMSLFQKINEGPTSSARKEK